MNLKLEELRKRLLDQTPTAAPPTETIYKRSADSVVPSEPAVVTNGIDAAEPKSTQLRETERSTAQPDLLASTVLQYVGETADPAKSRQQLTQAVTQVFETTRQYQDRLADLAKTIDIMEQTAQSATRAFEPIQAFRDQMQKLSSSFEPMRLFQEQLGTLAESFEPMKALHEQIAVLAEAFQIHLTQFARSMEPAKAFQARLTKLANSFEAIGELQGQFFELSETFRVASRSNGSNDTTVRN
jgi:DNA repair exonuclease SbcCD ATPase subunit